MSRVTRINTLLGSLFGKKRSHPDKLLAHHAKGVAELSIELANAQGLIMESDILRAVALTHDIGKVHQDFQDYLDGKGSGINHAKPSAWFTFSMTKNIWAAEVVCRHHTHLRNVIELKKEWIPDTFRLEDVQKNMRCLLPDWPWELNEEDYRDMEEFLLWDLAENVGLEQWLYVRALYSLLITADRMEAIGVGALANKSMPDFFRPNLPFRSEHVDTWRQQVQEACIQQAKMVNQPGVYTLTLPTGAGKTLTGLAIAHEWTQRFQCKSIIYTLPFISIVEQTTAVAQSVFGCSNVQEDHSLAYGKENKEEEKNNRSISAWRKMSTLFRYWREPVVITTLVQLWDALFDPRANSSMNFHRLYNSVIILDEPQVISPRYWQGLGEILSYLSEQCGAFFLLMTATQPHIPAQAELAPPKTVFPYSRHQYHILPGRYSLEQLPELLEKFLSLYEGSGMVVLNRKQAALEVYNMLKKLELNAPILFLSGWVTSWRRQRTLEQLKSMERNNERRYLVSTQVVEAGVDVDFAWVFRDLGPLDSVIQVAGRCNRHLRNEEPGKILVAELTDKTGRSLWRNVYNEILLMSARAVLDHHPIFDEKDVPTIIDEYYNKVQEKLTPYPISDYLVKGQWADIQKLIEEQPYEGVTIFIEENDEVWPLLKKLQEESWSLERRDEQKSIMQQVQQYAIEIPADLIRACCWKCSSIFSIDGEPVFRRIFEGKAWFLSRAAIKLEGGLYHPQVGFIPPDGHEVSLESRVM